MLDLKANTQTIVTIGPFVDATDGLTPETGITLGSADEAELIKHGSTSVVDISGATWAAVTNADGYYSLTLTTSHTDTEGQLTVIVQDDSVCLPVRNTFRVLSEAAYDSLYAPKDTGYMDVNVKAVSEDTTAADNLELACDNYSATRGLAGTALPAAAADAAGGLPISDAGGLNMDLVGLIYSQTLTAAIEAAVWDAAQASYVGVGTFGEIATEIASILVDTAEIGAAGAGLTAVPWNASWDAEVQSEVTDALNAYDPPTKAELDSGLAALNDPSAATTAAAVWDAVQSSHVTAGSFGVIASEIADILADTNELQTDDVPGLIAALNDPTAAAIADAVWDEAQSGHVSAGSFGVIATEIADILTDTNELQTDDVPGLIAALNDLSSADVNAACDTALSDYDGPTNTEMVAAFTEIKGASWSTTDTLEAIRDRGDAAWTTGAGGTPPQLLQNTTITGLVSQTQFNLTAGSADDDAYNGAVVVVTDQSTSTQKAVGSVSDYVGSTKTITLSSDPGIFTMANGDTIDVIANASTAPSAAAVRAEIDSNSTQLAAIVADTNELQTDWADGGRLDLILDARASQTSVNTIDGIVDAILVDTGTTLPASISTAQADLDTITGSDGVTLASVQSNYTPATAAELANTDSSVSALAILIGTAQADLDIITGSDGVTLATTQGNYAPATAAALAALNDLDAAGVRTAVGLASANLDTQLSTIDTVVDSVLLDTGTTLPATLASLNDLSAADVNAEVLDVIATDTLIDGRTIQSALRIIGAAAIGKVSGAGTSTEVFVGLDGSTTRATVTADASGNRTQVIYV